MSVKRFLVCVDDEVIGSSDLEGQDPGMGVACGPFFPTPSYEKVRSTFELFSAAVEDPRNEGVLATYYAQRDALGLTLRTSDERTVPAATIHITDFSRELGDDGYELEVIVQDRETYERFFSTR